ncbi:MAG: hypothetical protein K1X55_09210 [Chitinophagales bacterium]|nr:hypothetical protein [Chitinophagales bacterium]
MKKNISILFFIILTYSSFSNVAQPGVYNAGGTGGFSLYFPEDQAAYKKIQMKEEKVSIELFPGYAVIMADYQMYNSSDSIVTIKAGYPVNAFYHSNNQSNKVGVYFDSLYLFKAWVNDTLAKLSILATPDNNRQSFVGFSNTDNIGKWYWWSASFPPKTTTKISVFFVVNTNDASIRRGYTVRKYNAFVYVVESGSIWQPPIEKATFNVFLGKGVKKRNIHGTIPESGFVYIKKEKCLQLLKNNFSPNYKDNIIISYGKHQHDVDFKDVLKNGEVLYKDMEIKHLKALNTSKSKPAYFGNPNDIKPSFWWRAITMIFYLGIVACIVYLLKNFLILAKHFIQFIKRPS